MEEYIQRTGAIVMGRHLEEAMIFTLPTMPIPVQVPTQTSATRTMHRADTATQPASLKHFWRELIILNRMK